VAYAAKKGAVAIDGRIVLSQPESRPQV
jgi:hypothetical protein